MSNIVCNVKERLPYERRHVVEFSAEENSSCVLRHDGYRARDAN
jgi:hypothetical protein